MLPFQVSDLRWCEHVHNISAKATRVLNFVQHNIYHCTAEVKALAYTSLIRPHLEYASAAWDHYTARDSHQSTTSCSTICRKRLQADHISFRTYPSVRMAVTRRMQEKCSSVPVPVLQGSTRTGSCPRAWTSTSYKIHPIQWNQYIYCYIIPHWCPPQVPRYSCWPLLSRATPAVKGDHPSLDIHCRTKDASSSHHITWRKRKQASKASVSEK